MAVYDVALTKRIYPLWNSQKGTSLNAVSLISLLHTVLESRESLVTTSCRILNSDIDEKASRYVNVLNKQSRRVGNGQYSSLRFGWKSTAPYRKGNTISRIDSHALDIGRALWNTQIFTQGCSARHLFENPFIRIPSKIISPLQPLYSSD